MDVSTTVAVSADKFYVVLDGKIVNVYDTREEAERNRPSNATIIVVRGH